MKFDDLSNRVIGCAIEVHRTLGPGLLESTYEHCLAHELHLAGLRAQRQLALPVHYKGTELDCGYRVDLLVEDTIIVELKSVDHVLDIHTAQLLTYMKLSNKSVGLLINFNVVLLKQGLTRHAL